MLSGVTWSSKTEYVDLNTGEQITKHQASKMLKIKTDKHVKLNNNKSRGWITYTIGFMDNPQGDLFAGGKED